MDDWWVASLGPLRVDRAPGWRHWAQIRADGGDQLVGEGLRFVPELRGGLDGPRARTPRFLDENRALVGEAVGATTDRIEVVAGARHGWVEAWC